MPSSIGSSRRNYWVMIMQFESLKASNIMNCSYEITFDPRYTVVIGNNRQGKTLTARLIMLALYGTGTREKELHDSWKLRYDELTPPSERGSVELVIENDGRRYKIVRDFGPKNKSELYKEKDGSWGTVYARKDNEIKSILEDEVNITPGLMNIVMSNEQSLIGAISYDEDLQTSVWEGWKWRTEIIRGNIKSARETCGKRAGSIAVEVEGVKEKINSAISTWVSKGIFSKEEVKTDISEQKLNEKLSAISEKLGEIKKLKEFYEKTHGELIRFDNLTSNKTIDGIISLCDKTDVHIPEKEKFTELSGFSTQYSKTLEKVIEHGNENGIQIALNGLQDEEKKLKSAKVLSQRKKSPIIAECKVFPPEDDEKLYVQIPVNVSEQFKWEEIASAGVAVPYNNTRLSQIEREIKFLGELLKTIGEMRNTLKSMKDGLRDHLQTRAAEVGDEKESLQGQKIVLEETKDQYIDNIREMKKAEIQIRKLEMAKSIFNRMFEELSEEESLRKIRKETVAFINRIFEKVYDWDINARLEDENKIIITDDEGRVRSHPSGSETHILGLAWRWMVARSFNLPLVLDELDILLDDKNYEKTRKLIEEQMDRQTVILTLRESLKDLPGKIYCMTREGGISQLSETE